jgi:hypothetical protein
LSTIGAVNEGEIIREAAGLLASLAAGGTAAIATGAAERGGAQLLDETRRRLLDRLRLRDREQRDPDALVAAIGHALRDGTLPAEELAEFVAAGRGDITIAKTILYNAKIEGSFYA